MVSLITNILLTLINFQFTHLHPLPCVPDEGSTAEPIAQNAFRCFLINRYYYMGRFLSLESGTIYNAFYRRLHSL